MQTFDRAISTPAARGLLLLCALLAAPAAAQPTPDLASATEELVAQLREPQRRGEIDRLAVLDFSDLQGNVLELGRYLAEETIRVLVPRAQGLQVIERSQLDLLLREHQLSATGLLAPENAQRLGRISGVDVLILGTLTPFEAHVSVNLKALTTTTGTVIATAAAEIPRSRAIDELLAREVLPDEAQRSTGVGDYQGVARSQRIKYLQATLVAFEASARTVRATLSLEASHRRHGAAVALADPRAQGLADYWKFFPTSEGTVRDDRGNVYSFSSATGLGFARTRQEWLVLEAGEAAPVTLTFEKRDDAAAGRSFNLSIDLWLAYRDDDGEQRNGVFPLHLSEVRPR